MSSSFKATSRASVRATPAAQVAAAGAWFLDELATPANAKANAQAKADRPLPSQITAEERARLIDEGYARGLADGETRARNAAQNSVTDAINVLRSTAAQMTEIASMAPDIAESNVAALAIIVARQIIGREVGLDRELVASLVRRALTEFPIDQSVRIRVNPVDLSLLTVAAGSSEAITGTRDAAWLADPRVARGGCLVEGRDRIVDGRVDTALERAYRRMAQVDAS